MSHSMNINIWTILLVMLLDDGTYMTIFFDDVIELVSFKFSMFVARC